MPTTYYYTVNDEIIGEHTVGQSRLDYLTDALGSVVATIDQTLTTKSTARYKPYGADLASTGTQPINAWVGKWGYRRTGRAYAEEYARARTFSTTGAAWLTIDPIWPFERPYAYCGGSPTDNIDPSGLGCPTIDCPQNQAWRSHGAWLDELDIANCYEYACNSGKWDSNEYSYCLDYVAKRNHGFIPTTRVEGIQAAGQFKYGNSCGRYRKAHASGYSFAIDCIDRACTRHDQCLATWTDAIYLHDCNKKLYMAAQDCLGDCYKDSNRSKWQQDECYQAALQIWMQLSIDG